MKKGELVVTKAPLWHRGTDVGGRLGKIVRMEGYVWVDIFEYQYNPVKCFRNEVEEIEEAELKQEEKDVPIEDIWDALGLT